MRFGIRPFTGNAEELLEISQEEHDLIVVAKEALVTMIGIEQKFDLLLENYADYERELLNLALHHSMHRDLDWASTQDDLAAVSRRLANVLSAARLYVDQVRHDLSTTLGKEHDVSRTVATGLSTQYDGRLGYRVMESLRNLMQHRSLPIDHLKYASDAQPNGVRFGTVPCMEPGRLKEGGLKATVAEELEAQGKEVAVTPLLREYIEGLAAVHEAFRAASRQAAGEWDALIARTQAQAADEWGGGDDRAFLVTAWDSSGEVTKSTQVFTELTRYRQALERKNTLFRGLARRYVSGESVPDA